MIKYTGERIVPDRMKPMNGLLLEHIARYQFCLHYMKGRVLDIACGVGYGAQMIAKNVKEDLSEVIAVDSDEETIKYARARYYHPIVDFQLGNAVDPDLSDIFGKFDSIVSFETIEHVEEEAAFLDNLYSLLNPGGTLIISTPFGQGRGMPTNEPFHVHQLTERQFEDVFLNYSFQHVEFYFQKGVLIEPKRKGKHYTFGIAVCVK